MGRAEKIDLPQCSPVLTTLGLWFIEDREGHSEGIVHDYNSFFGNEELRGIGAICSCTGPSVPDRPLSRTHEAGWKVRPVVCRRQTRVSGFLSVADDRRRLGQLATISAAGLWLCLTPRRH